MVDWKCQYFLMVAYCGQAVEALEAMGTVIQLKEKYLQFFLDEHCNSINVKEHQLIGEALRAAQVASLACEYA